MSVFEISSVLNLIVDNKIVDELPQLYLQSVDADQLPPIPDTVLLSGIELATIKYLYSNRKTKILSEWIQALLLYADEILEQPYISIRDKLVTPPSGDKADYLSYPRYYWPSSKNNNRKRKDGLVNPEVYSENYDLIRLEKLSDRLLITALAYTFSEDEKYSKYCINQITNWFISPETAQNPNFQFAQYKPEQNHPNDVGIIEAHRFIYVLEAVSLISNSLHWTENNNTILKKWFHNLLTWLQTSEAGQKCSKRRNNIATWYDLQCAIYALYSGEIKLAEEIIRNSASDRLIKQLETGEIFSDELKRTDPYDYYIFNLLAFLHLSKVGSKLGIDLWKISTNDGKNLKSAIKWILDQVDTDDLASLISLKVRKNDNNEPITDTHSEVAKSILLKINHLFDYELKYKESENKIDQLTEELEDLNRTKDELNQRLVLAGKKIKAMEAAIERIILSEENLQKHSLHGNANKSHSRKQFSKKKNKQEKYDLKQKFHDHRRKIKKQLLSIMPTQTNKK